jgi:hypothetical protein
MSRFKNKFFEHNFLSFLSEHNNFFKHYQLKFVVSVLEILKKKNPNLKITNEYKEFVENLYKSFFIENNFENFILKNPQMSNELKEANIDFAEILNKAFLLMSNSFIKKIIKEKDAISKLKKIASLLEFYIEYIKYHLNEPFFSNTKLPKEIKECYLNNIKLSLFSVYKGIPISHITTIHTLNEEKGFIEVSANYYQIIASKFQKEIYLLEPKSNKTFKANIAEVYPNRKILELSNIEKINRKTPKRNYIRVQPHKKTEVILKKDDKKYITEMYDISLKGSAVYSDKKLPFEIGDFIILEFYLEFDENSTYFFSLQGELKSISKLNEQTYRYHFYFEPNPQEEKILEKYIIKREKEIIKELQIYLKKELINLV